MRKQETSPRKHGGGRKPKNKETGNRVKTSVHFDPVLLVSLREESAKAGKSLSDVVNGRLEHRDVLVEINNDYEEGA